MENQQATRLTILHSGKILSIWFFSTDIFLADQFSIDFFLNKIKFKDSARKIRVEGIYQTLGH